MFKDFFWFLVRHLIRGDYPTWRNIIRALLRRQWRSDVGTWRQVNEAEQTSDAARYQRDLHLLMAEKSKIATRAADADDKRDEAERLLLAIFHVAPGPIPGLPFHAALVDARAYLIARGLLAVTT